jgi:nucleoside-diphosphate-sugar epimerase
MITEKGEWRPICDSDLEPTAEFSHQPTSVNHISKAPHRILIKGGATRTYLPPTAMSVKVVVLGAGGLVGARMIDDLVRRNTFAVGDGSKTALPLEKIVLFDVRDISGDLSAEQSADTRVSCVAGDLTDRVTLDAVFAPDGCTRVTVIQLAAVLSGYAESDFELGMKVNLQGAIGVMDALRAVGEKLGGPQIYLFTSTDYVTAYNATNKAMPTNEESFRLSPVSYGVQKACVELLLCDYSRKGFIDGRVGRLSAVLGRPGWSNSISWSYTGIFTQPLEGKDFECPGALPMDRPFPCSDVRNNVAGLLYLASEVNGDDLGHNRVVQLPARSFTLAAIWKACQEVAQQEGIETLGKVTRGELPRDATVKELNVCPRVDISKAVALGLPNNISIHEIIRDYVHVHINKGGPKGRKGATPLSSPAGNSKYATRFTGAAGAPSESLITGGGRPSSGRRHYKTADSLVLG